MHHTLGRPQSPHTRRQLHRLRPYSPSRQTHGLSSALFRPCLFSFSDPFLCPACLGPFAHPLVERVILPRGEVLVEHAAEGVDGARGVVATAALIPPLPTNGHCTLEHQVELGPRQPVAQLVKQVPQLLLFQHKRGVRANLAGTRMGASHVISDRPLTLIRQKNSVSLGA